MKLQTFALIGCAAAGVLFADGNRYILDAPAALAPGIEAQYGLTLVKTIHAGSYVVQSSINVNPQQLIAQVRANPSVTLFEADSESEIPEGNGGGGNSAAQMKIAMQETAQAVAWAAADTKTVPFFGATVRDSYVNQPASLLIRELLCQQQNWTGAGTVAVIDTGADPSIPALQKVLVPGYDFLNETAGVYSELNDLTPAARAALTQSTVAFLDGQRQTAVLNQSTVAFLDQSTVAFLDSNKLPLAFGHGTMVAGLIHLVAPTAKIMPLKVFQPDGTAHVSDVVRAIYYATDHGANVINMSFSLTDLSQELMLAINYATAHKVICVASAGNDGKEMMVYPAGFHPVIGVGSTTYNDLRSLFSNFGSASVRIAAPGEGIVTFYPGNHYAAAWGTSFSTALVSGAVSVLNGVNPKLGISGVSDALRKGHRLTVDFVDSRLDVESSASAAMSYTPDN